MVIKPKGFGFHIESIDLVSSSANPIFSPLIGLLREGRLGLAVWRRIVLSPPVPLPAYLDIVLCRLEGCEAAPGLVPFLNESSSDVPLLADGEISIYRVLLSIGTFNEGHGLFGGPEL